MNGRSGDGNRPEWNTSEKVILAVIIFAALYFGFQILRVVI